MRRKKHDPKLAVALIRVSTNRQELGPLVQRHHIEEWAKREGVRVASWHEEHVSGGADPAKRPGFQAALAAVAAFKAGILVLHERSRLARDVDVAGYLRFVVRQQGAEVVTTDATGSRLEGRIRDVLGEEERAEIRRRVRDALARKRARGERISRHAPFGFRFVRGRLVPDERERRIVARMKRMRARGMSFARIAARLNATAPRREGTKMWWAASVWDAVRSPVPALR